MTLKDFDDFDAAEMRRCAGLSSAVYGQNHLGFTALKFFSAETDTQGAVVIVRGTAFVAFRGTSSLQDWGTDFNAKLADYPGQIRIHRGFAAALDSVIMRVRKLIVANNVKRIVLTGHSLGGALAMLCAWRFAFDGLAVSAVYTFGQPRVGDRSFALAYSEELGDCTFRMVNRFDPVPWVPGVLLGYRHAGQELFIDAHDRLIVNPSLWAKLGRVARELLAQPALLMGPLGILQLINDADAAIGDHSAAGYEALAESIATQLASQNA